MNLFHVKSDLPDEEIFDQLYQNENIRIERIISCGQCSPPEFWYEQEDDEWVLLLQGEAVISYRNHEKVLMKTGDYLLIPAGIAHRVEMTSADPPCIWLAIFFPPAANDGKRTF